MEQWEYKIITSKLKGWLDKKTDPDTEQILNTLGNEGWELVATTTLTGESGGSWGGSTLSFIFVFKRKKT